MPERSKQQQASAPRDIRDLLGFRLSLLATISDRKAQSLISRRFDLNLGEWRALGAIHALAPVTLAALARYLYLDKGQLSRTLKALTSRGYLTSAREPGDWRNLRFRLTAEGRRQHDRILAFTTARNGHLLDALTARERTEIFRLIDKLTKATADAYDAEMTSAREAAPRRPARARPEARP
ncbi:MAG: MarR family transcriptional regulator [Hyphomicrobiales bacterium]|nr:MarR family transcriptional regulator [Hyphomicrobiales bacterium]